MLLHDFLSAFSCSPPISDYDVFNEGKTQSFFESQQAVMALCTYLEGINKNMEGLSKNQLLEHFNKLLLVSILSTLQSNESLIMNESARTDLSTNPFSIFLIQFNWTFYNQVKSLDLTSYASLSELEAGHTMMLHL